MTNFNNNFINKEIFSTLLEKAKGDRSISQYASEIEISATYISRLLRKLEIIHPSPDIISKLAKGASNGVTYHDLMIAAGYKSHNNKQTINNECSYDVQKQSREIGNIEGSKLLKKLRNNSNMTLKEVSSILEVSFQYIDQLEQGIKSPSDLMLDELAKIYNVDDYIISGAYNRVPLSAKILLEENVGLQIALSKLSTKDSKEEIIKKFVDMIN